MKHCLFDVCTPLYIKSSQNWQRPIIWRDVYLDARGSKHGGVSQTETTSTSSPQRQNTGSNRIHVVSVCACLSRFNRVTVTICLVTVNQLKYENYIYLCMSSVYCMCLCGRRAVVHKHVTQIKRRKWT